MADKMRAPSRNWRAISNYATHSSVLHMLGRITIWNIAEQM